MTDPVLGGAAAKVAAGGAGAGVNSALRRPWARWRAAAKVSGRARGRGQAITARLIRGWLTSASTVDYLRTAGTASRRHAEEKLRSLLPQVLAQDDGAVAGLCDEILAEYALRLGPAEAIVATGSRVMAETRARAEWITRALEAGDRSGQVFEGDLGRVQVVRRDLLKRAHDEWPAMAQVVRALVASDDRGTALRDWSERPPAGLADAGVAPWLALALLSLDHGQDESFRFFMLGALDRGATPRGYWLARVALRSDPWPEVFGERAIADHGLGAAMLAVEATDYDKALTELRHWHPTGEEDAAIKLLLGAEVKRSQGHLSEAIADLEGYDGPSGGVRLALARFLLRRTQLGSGTLPAGDAARAMTLAIEVRDARRLWAGPSEEAAMVACQAAVLAGDHERAWQIVRPAPEGEANSQEARSPELRREALSLAAGLAAQQVARELLGDSTEPFERMLVAAAEASAGGDQQELESTLLRAYELSPESIHRLRVASLLAHMGAELPDLTLLRTEFPGQTANIEEIAQFVRASDGDLSRLRARSLNSPSLTMLLADRLNATGEPYEAGQALERGATRWVNPRMAVMAAERYLVTEHHAEAVKAADRALAMGGAGWAGEYDARVLLFRAHEALGNARDALNQARQLVALAPDNEDARWALIKCLLRDGDAVAAWGVLTARGVPISPRDAREALIWTNLVAQHDRDRHAVGRLLEALHEWRDDEEVAGTVLAMLIADDFSSEMTEVEAAAIRAELAGYEARFPQSQVLRSVTVDPEDPIAGMKGFLKSAGEREAILAEWLKKGTLPVGAFSWMLKAPYLELLVVRLGGSVSAHHPDYPSPGLSGLISRTVVLDPSAAATLALLDSELAEKALGQFSLVETTDVAYRDARAAVAHLSKLST